jgi:hypothetical protein
MLEHDLLREPLLGIMVLARLGTGTWWTAGADPLMREGQPIIVPSVRRQVI